GNVRRGHRPFRSAGMNAQPAKAWVQASDRREASALRPVLVESDGHAAGLAVGAAPGFEPRLVIAGSGTEDMQAYRARGGYAGGAAGSELIQQVMDAGLLGRGGAAFPTGVKLQTLADQPGPKYLVANG